MAIEFVSVGMQDKCSKRLTKMMLEFLKFHSRFSIHAAAISIKRLPPLFVSVHLRGNIGD